VCSSGALLRPAETHQTATMQLPRWGSRVRIPSSAPSNTPSNQHHQSTSPTSAVSLDLVTPTRLQRNSSARPVPRIASRARHDDACGAPKLGSALIDAGG
jgi:hypothetical protein